MSGGDVGDAASSSSASFSSGASALLAREGSDKQSTATRRVLAALALLLLERARFVHKISSCGRRAVRPPLGVGVGAHRALEALVDRPFARRVTADGALELVRSITFVDVEALASGSAARRPLC